MQVVSAYLFVVMIWATTPLAIQLSNSSLSFALAITLRTGIALLVFLLMVALLRKPVVIQKKNWKSYFAGALSLYPNMLLVYWSSQFIPSGLVAVIFGIYPFIVGIFSLLLLRENMFSVSKVVALILSLAGLALLHIEQLDIGGQAFLGILGITTSSFLFALSSVLVKVSGKDIDPIGQSLGVLLLSAPAFALSWWLLDGQIPHVVDLRSLIGVGYLAIVGSVLGQTLFFFVLKHCSMFTVSLIPLITPLFAVSIGYVFMDESLGRLSIIGSLLILVALVVYQGAMAKFWEWISALYGQS